MNIFKVTWHDSVRLPYNSYNEVFKEERIFSTLEEARLSAREQMNYTDSPIVISQKNENDIWVKIEVI